jgi:hypothetical protein
VNTYSMLALLIGGAALLLFALWQIRSGKSDLLFWTDATLKVTRTDNGCFYWAAIILQLLIAMSMIGVGAFFVFF